MRPCEICGVKSGTSNSLAPSASVLSCHHHSTPVLHIHSFVYHIINFATGSALNNTLGNNKWKKSNKTQLSFLGVLAILRRATINFIMSVRSSFHKEQLGSHWAYFHQIRHFSIFSKVVLRKTKFH